VICGDPAKIYFKIETALKQDDIHSKCPQDLSTAQIVRIPVPNYDNILVSVTVKDGKGNKFDNITSLNINWRTSLDIVTFQHQQYIPTEIVNVNDYTVPGKSKDLKIWAENKSENCGLQWTWFPYRSPNDHADWKIRTDWSNSRNRRISTRSLEALQHSAKRRSLDYIL